jgi:TonB family protein
MALRCLLFTSDEGTAEPILQVLAGLGVEGEHCSDAVATVDKVTQQSFQIVIIDWDQQPEAALLLAAARERKAAERPITLAIVSNDVSVPQALQAGANSILRKPILVSQAKDTLTTAHDLLRSKQESAANAAQAAAAGASSFGGPSSGGPATPAATLPASMTPPKDRTLRRGDFLQSSGSAPGGDFVTGSELHESLAPTSAEPVDPLHDLEPMAASMTAATEKNEEKESHASDTPPQPGETKGLEWFLRTRAVKAPPAPAQAPAPAAPAKPELLGYGEAPSYSPPPKHSDDGRGPAPEAKSHSIGMREPRREPDHELKHEPRRPKADDQKKEAELFAYISGEKPESEETFRQPFRFKGAIIGALVLASFAIVAAPQAPWHPKIGAAWAHGRQSLHTWLNPQLVTTPQAPAAHEDFARAGDEYKLPVTENIPDATTDPSQIRVLPVIDPTIIKKSNPEGGNALQPSSDGDGTGPTPIDQAPTSSNPDSQIPSASPETSQPTSPPAAGGTSASQATPSSTAAVPAVVAPPHSDPFTPGSSPSSSVSPVLPRPTPPRDPQPHSAPAQGSVPSSLKSQMASSTPDAGGNKSAESAMPSIEPVTVPEFTERALLTEQPALAYPASAKGQQGTVILQVLIGRDGTVKDAKFLQGSLAFARAAIDGVKLWKFKPYAMNGRPVSVQTLMTINFKPTS